MREIKFLVYLNTQEGVKRYSVNRVDYKRYGDFEISRIYYGDYYVIGDALKDGFAHLVQYTGLVDKNGREIYEGDIIEIEYIEDEVKTLHKVVWGGNEYPAWDVKPYWDGECNVFSDIYCSGYYKVKVIGNVYENPELLEGN